MNPLKKSILIVFIFTLVVHPRICSQIRIIPFTEDSQGHLILHYQIKGIPLKLLFDIGSNSNLLDYMAGEKLGVFPRDDQKFPQTAIGGITFDIALVKEGQDSKEHLDSILGFPTHLTDINKIFRRTRNDEIYDGMMSKTVTIENYTIEFDFEKKQVLFWDSIPDNYINTSHKNVKTIRLVSPDYASYKSGKLRDLYAIHGKLTLLDSLVYETNFILDTGCSSYLTLLVSNKDLLNKIIEFRKKKVQEYGNEVRTIKLDIKELGVDSMLAKTTSMDKSIETAEMNQLTYPFGAYKIGGLLGMKFFRQYKRVLLDGKNKIGYFIQ